MRRAKSSHVTGRTKHNPQLRLVSLITIQKINKKGLYFKNKQSVIYELAAKVKFIMQFLANKKLPVNDVSSSLPICFDNSFQVLCVYIVPMISRL